MGKTFWLLRFDSFFWEENDNDQVKYCILLPRPTANPPPCGLVCFTRSGSKLPTVTFGWHFTEWDGWFQYFMPLAKRSREVVFTSSTVTTVTPYRMIWMITNENGE
jgi:hypothetical protein